MILSIVGIFMGILNDQKQRTNGIGADLMMRASNTSIMNGVGGATMSVKIADVIQKLPHVAVVAPANAHLNTQGSVEVQYGIDYESFNALKPFVFLSGGRFKGPNDAIVDDVFASSRNPQTGKDYAVGDTLSIVNHPFQICGIVEHGKGGRKLIPLETMNDMVETHRKRPRCFSIKTDESHRMLTR